MIACIALIEAGQVVKDWPQESLRSSLFRDRMSVLVLKSQQSFDNTMMHGVRKLQNMKPTNWQASKIC